MAMASPVTDIYATAVSIRNLLEALIKQHGKDVYTSLLDAVTDVLTRLETLVYQYDSDQSMIDELNCTVDQLEAEKRNKVHEELKYQKDVELQEESWRSEAKTQKELVVKLQVDNRKLHDVLKRQLSDAEDIDRMKSHEEELEEEIANYKERLQKERDALKVKECAIIRMDTELCELNAVLEREQHRCLEYECRMSVSQEQSNHLISTVSLLEAQLCDRDLQLSRIRGRSKRESGCSDDQSVDTCLSAEDLPRMIERLGVSGKMVIDLDDCEEPHVTLADLNRVMSERNQLKKQVLSVQEELAQYRPDSVSTEVGAQLINADEADPPVQGPINREPDEKLFPEKFSAKESLMKRLMKVLSPKNLSDNKSPRSVISSREVLMRSKVASCMDQVAEGDSLVQSGGLVEVCHETVTCSKPVNYLDCVPVPNNHSDRDCVVSSLKSCSN